MSKLELIESELQILGESERVKFQIVAVLVFPLNLRQVFLIFWFHRFDFYNLVYQPQFELTEFDFQIPSEGMAPFALTWLQLRYWRL